MFIVVAMLFSSVFSLSIVANAQSEFTPRLVEPVKENANDVKYYYSDNNLYYKYGWGMPNCTAYAYGRAYEILGTVPNLSPNSAYQWFDYNKDYSYYAYGNTPKLGAIACWYYYRNDGSISGHVAVVEKIEDNTITFSNSAWGWKNFYLSYADISDPKAGESNWNFQGYIYIGEFQDNDNTEVTQPSTYEPGEYTVNVGDDSYLNMRNGAGTIFDRVGSIPNKTSLTITETKYSNGYNWGYTEYNGINGWVALEFCEIKEEEVKEPESILIGDINNDGNVNITDASFIQRYLSNQIELSETQEIAADFNGNGKIAIDDITALQRYCAS